MRRRRIFTVTIDYDDAVDLDGRPYTRKNQLDIDPDETTSTESVIELLTGCPFGMGWMAEVRVKELGVQREAPNR
jgi:predicted RNase H-related nuclease YkuK (DUF458 family)